MGYKKTAYLAEKKSPRESDASPRTLVANELLSPITTRLARITLCDGQYAQIADVGGDGQA
ncbi:MAG: hypothetical protein A2261_04275 [Candidatus Magasanikbacteria bacterium RIFOXYA2_FULL_44_8]|uniref:Uncharacterized protein n=1 Tax=Candidatus Magasanikbacteria bacterium RIFOXYA2_FULL_44_8 TaxID=1798696 RepID=A0A1F6NLQ5_9BACT|nr:MAG: hypothetical protein A2261_04275 [Candidatus Magasanikbacteria bacterium RIFOXYA2_FULL_44_8]